MGRTCQSSERRVNDRVGMWRVRALAAWIVTIAVTIVMLSAGCDAARADDPGSSSPAVVYCYDRARNNVSRVLPFECGGVVISEAEAAAIKEQHDRDITRAMKAHPSAAPEGAHLASLGSAFYVDELGRLITNKHVVDGCRAITVRRVGRDADPAVVLAVDAEQDLALLQGEAKSTDYAVFRSGPSVTANTVFIVGYPDEGLSPLEPIATAGTLLKTSAQDVPRSHLVMRISARRGNSGGPILDDRGLVIGVLAAKLDIPRVYAMTGLQAEDTALGISLPAVLAFLARTKTLFHVANIGEALDASRVLTFAQPFVARAECWK